MKKFLVVLLAVCMLFAFAACSNNEQPAGDDANGENAQTGDTVPVSYTHLDVYKRQVTGRCGIKQNSPWNIAIIFFSEFFLSC